MKSSTTNTSNTSTANTNSSAFLNKLKAKSQVQEKSSLKLNSKITGTLSGKASILGTFFKSKAKEGPKKSAPLMNFDLYSGHPPIFKGWIKYFYYQQDKKFKEPKDFFINNAFYKQRVQNKNLHKKGLMPGEADTPENNVFVNIPSKFHFYVTLDPHFMTVHGDRTNSLTTKLESLNLDMIDPLHPTDIDKTGVKEIGSFEEGHCVDLSAHTLKNFDKNFMPSAGIDDKTEPVHWVVCMDDGKEYSKFFAVLSSIIDAKEKVRERPQNEQAEKEEGKEETESDEEHYKGWDANPNIDGYLKRINDWTQCTLKCGGGWTYQQWKCIPPKPLGKPCSGDLIRKKKCNEDPCPVIGEGAQQLLSASSGKSRTVEVIKENPIVKTQKVSKRPQQNLDCVVREEDILHEYQDEDNGKVSIPSRIIMNTKSITLYSDLETKKTIFSFDISQTKFVLVKNEECCFKLRSENKEYKICGMSKCDSFTKSWTRSFDLFLSKCYNVHRHEPEDPLKAENPTDPYARASEGDLAMNMEMNEETAKAKSALIANKLAKKLSLQSQNAVETTQKKALKVINREIDIEEMIRKEEMMRTQERIKNKLEEFKHEELKKKKLEEALDEQEQMQNTVISDMKTTSNVNEIQNEAEKEILERRNKLKKKIERIRQLADRRAKIIQNKINIVRNKMTTEMVEATKNGNANTCKSNYMIPEKMTKYCNENVVEDYAKNNECKDKDNFCFICCDHEFGKANISGKDACYTTCLG
eukprot:CAMPEP_0170517440 /NCGR_PEP_ID=MMETSP0209-20121228/3432_1 /TAXON_ID=665100 ORGANISM="Litonotus pictus, Strain P1" /NCGR_SAMPLE_ID=MMETSP0209 /ASSEMBLY_ACC=CAM_ASM_000301 /LENGTH=752 /DNA_ID=CAMNT_0010802691 /DNA_START=71 /DNA_END=2325 /DNA_ORIENTATION=+